MTVGYLGKPKRAVADRRNAHWMGRRFGKAVLVLVDPARRQRRTMRVLGSSGGLWIFGLPVLFANWMRTPGGLRQRIFLL
jgi:hypothetical protein